MIAVDTAYAPGPRRRKSVKDLAKLVRRTLRPFHRDLPPATTLQDNPSFEDDLERSRDAFYARYPAYALTTALEDLRKREYARLDRGETYVDWMGSAVFPDCIVRHHAQMLLDPCNVFGNTHSRSESSKLSASHAQVARAAVLRFFDADTNEYAVIFTQNASTALKLVGESYPFTTGSSLVLGVDAHNSVHGIRVFAERQGADVRYFSCGQGGGVDMASLRENLIRMVPRDAAPAHSLLVLTGQSNVTGAKAPLEQILPEARAAGVHVLLDAAALAPTSRISLRRTPVDAMAVSFYKMFGYPTGVGALIARRGLLRNVMRKAWFAGGTVDVVQVPGSGSKSYTFPAPDEGVQSDHDVEKWEDGTPNFLALASVTQGLELLSRYQDVLPLRLSILSHWLSSTLLSLRHVSGAPMVRILSTLPQRLAAADQESSSGSVVACVLLDARGRPLRNDVVELAAKGHVAMRAGCHCNAGAVMTLLHRSGLFARADGSSPLMEWMEHIHLRPEVASKDAVARELFSGDSSFGLIRFSLGLGSNFEDVWKLVSWVRHTALVLDATAT
ncbi:PLP-dependent transferase [Auricularia subglabra TFB-10046 SS5]|uniref:PLP-dependent transferase n=1 Tax=Auricularia subglabra (strain TFB-10046 / SS5) TaxID=717982 RepID=J0WTI0_AURST|nr:PLP-dependent transferase [Auricularia subglabra TFB-10046 SS5]